MKKKLTPASIVTQKKWASFPVAKKNNLRKMLTDRDKDGVPNKYDCHPKNKRKQESFLPADEEYLSLAHEIKLGKKLNEGTEGAVYTLANNRNLVIKVPRGYKADYEGLTSSAKRRITSSEKRRVTDNRLHDTKESIKSIKNEADCYTKLGFNDKPLFIPTKVVELGNNDLNNGNYVGLIRPRVTPIMDFHGSVKQRNIDRLTRSQIEMIRKQLIDLTEQGYVFGDGLQIGLDIANRPLIYDMGKLQKFSWNEPRAFVINNEKWIGFLRNIGKLPTYGDYRDELKQYGEITPKTESTWW
jgi:hypothetical protein